MVPDGEERTGNFDDLFEDLDKFFAQGNQSRSRRARRSGPEGEEAGAAATGEEARSDELLPPGWEPDIEGLDLGTDATAGEPKSPSPGKADPEAEEPDRVRDALGDEGQVEVVEYSSERPASPGGGDPLGYEGEEDLGEGVEIDEPAEEGHELNLEDLKKAPPEYRDLPRSSDQGTSEERGEGVFLGEHDRASIPAEQVEVPEGGENPEERFWDEPDMADVEAAADNLAASLGDTSESGPVEEELLADIEEPEGPRTVRVGGSESLTGPTWEEPSSHPLMSEQGAPQPGRNLPAAVLTAAVLAAVALISLAVAKAAFAVVAGGVVLLGQAELYATMQRKGHQPATALGLVIGAFTLAGAYLKGEQAMLFFVVLGLMLSFLWYMAAAPKAREGALAHMGSTLLGVLYVPFLAGFLLLILAQPKSGRALMLAVLGLTFIYDIAAFVFGSVWGSRALAPTISPKKSWEGLLGATVVTFALAVVILPSIDPLDLVKSVGLAIVVAVFAPLGDLAESTIKRDLGVKDMGSILPGHGGVLDRIDSVLFVAPAAFYFLRLIF
jgi:phosphatidate cytidylyltransferase